MHTQNFVHHAVDKSRCAAISTEDVHNKTDQDVAEEDSVGRMCRSPDRPIGR